MYRTGLVYHRDYLLHSCGQGHPERPERISESMKLFRETGILDDVLVHTPRPCTVKDILRVHTREHLEHIRGLSEKGGEVSRDTFCGKGTYDIARLAAGGCIDAGNLVMEEKVDNAFALVRPPGHHASRNKADGFCFFNNAAILARYLQKVHGLKRIFIYDWDVHAANGTMDIFYDDPTVLNISIHQDPKNFYPKNGFMEQTGRREGDGFTVNIPVPPGTGDIDYIYLLDEFVIPMMEAFEPGFVIICAGQDAHMEDPISSLYLTENGFGEMTRKLLSSAQEVCDGRVVTVLEGGYELQSFTRSNYAIMKSLLGSSEVFDIRGEVKESTDRILCSLNDLLLYGFTAFKTP